MPSSPSPSRFPVESPREAAGVGAAAGLVAAVVVGAALAPPGDPAAGTVAVGCFLTAAPPVYVLARARRGERAARVVGYAAAWVATGLAGAGARHAGLFAEPGTGGVAADGLLVFVGPGAWVAAIAALHIDPRRLVGWSGAVAALAALGVGGGRVLVAAWLPEADFGAGLVGGAVAARCRRGTDARGGATRGRE